MMPPHADPRASQGWARRLIVGGGAGWGIADQVFSSLTNFALGFVVIRGTDAAGFGAFSLGFGVYLIALNMSRAVATLPLTIRYSTAAVSRWRAGTAATTGTALVLGTAIGACCVAIGAAVPYRPVADAFLGFGFAMPGLLLQDAWRYAFFAAGRGGAALVTDIVWAFSLVPLFALVLAAEVPIVGWAALAWGSAATLGALAGVVLAGLRPAPLRARAWWREHRDIAPQYAGEMLVTTVTGQLTPYAIALVGGLDALGVLRAGEFLLGPFNILFQGVQLVAVPQGARVFARRAQDLIPYCGILAVTFAVAATAWGVLVVLVPEAVGLAIIGPIWTEARGVVVPLAVALACLGLQTGPAVGLRVLAAARRSLRVSSIMALLVAGGMVAGCIAAGAAGAAWGKALVMGVGVPWWTWELRGGFRDHHRREVTPTAPVAKPT